MSWFFLALIGPFLYALTNYIDKIILEKYFKEGGVGTIILFSSLLSVFVLPFIFWADRTVFSMPTVDILVLATVGILNVLLLWCYLTALKDEEASIAIVFYQLVPVLALVLGYFILGETITFMQLTAMAIIIVGTTIVSFEIDLENNVKLRRKTVWLMLAASSCWALGSVLFKAVALEEDVLRSLFWENLMLVLVGIGIFVFVRSYRVRFLLAMRNNSKEIILLCATNEGLYILANFVFAFAFMLAPISLVLLSNSFQPIFVLAIGICLTIFFPHIATEKIQAKHLWQKIIAICITGVGTYLLLAF